MLPPPPSASADPHSTFQWRSLTGGVVAVVGYWIVFSTKTGSGVILLALPGLFLLGRLATARQAFYAGLAAGLEMYGPPLAFLYQVFGRASAALFLIAGLPIAVFALLLQQAQKRFSPPPLVLVTASLWTGIEFFRSELYHLRFAWLLPGQATAFVPGVRLLCIGVYGLGFVFAVAGALLVSDRRSLRLAGLVASAGLAVSMYWPSFVQPSRSVPLRVAGVQLEFPAAATAARAVDTLATAHPEAQILVLSEYSFEGPIPEVVREVVRKHHRYLVAGGTRPLADGTYYDTAFVVGPDGSDVFEQAKSVPVQFMSDGLPAERRRVWESPWGKIGIAVCYDLSYAEVMDDFIREGAAGLIVPTEDGQNWGEYERRMLHGRMAPVRSAEYGIPTFGVWSSGMSQLTESSGRVIATAGYPGQGEMIAGPFDLSHAGHVPWDRWLALAASVFVAGFAVFLSLDAVVRRVKTRARKRAG